MSYLIFQKNNNLYKIADNQVDLDNLNIIKSDYTIVEINQNDFNDIKFGIKQPTIKEDGTIEYIIFTPSRFCYKFLDEADLKNNILLIKKQIQMFLDNNPNHPKFNIWNNYNIQLNSFVSTTYQYPLNKSIEQCFNDLGQPSLNILQLP